MSLWFRWRSDPPHLPLYCQISLQYKPPAVDYARSEPTFPPFFLFWFPSISITSASRSADNGAGRISFPPISKNLSRTIEHKFPDHLKRIGSCSCSVHNISPLLNLIVWNSKVSRTLLPKLRARMLWQAPVFLHVPPFRESGSEVHLESLPAAVHFFSICGMTAQKMRLQTDKSCIFQLLWFIFNIHQIFSPALSISGFPKVPV